MSDNITVRDFGVDPISGKTVKLFSLFHDGKLIAEVMTYGATLLSLYAPGDKTDASHDVVVGYDHLSPYFGDTPYYGATVGRVCNRITNGQFDLNGRLNTLSFLKTCDAGVFAAHGGKYGFNRKVWDGEIVDDFVDGKKKVVMRYTSPDGEEGYPGKLHVAATYHVDVRPTGSHAVVVTYHAKLAPGEVKSTIVNLTNHAYFNLAGNGPETKEKDAPHYTILNHRLAFRSKFFLPVSPLVIPTGEFKPCAKEPVMDFAWDYFDRCPDKIEYPLLGKDSSASGSISVPSIIKNYGVENFGRRIGDDIDNTEVSKQLEIGTGYDHSWALEKGRDKPFTTAFNDLKKSQICSGGGNPLLAAVAVCTYDEGRHHRYLAAYTTEPGVHFYAGNWLGDDLGKKNPEKDQNGNPVPHLLNRKGPGYPLRGAFALELQHYPDSCNKPQFPSIVLKPGNSFTSVNVFEVGSINRNRPSKI